MEIALGWLERLIGRSGPPTLPRARGTAPSTAVDNDGAQRVPPSEPLREASGYAVVDVETTGLSPRRDRIVSIGVVLLTSRGEIEHEWGTLVNPQGPVGATHIHGIRDEDVVDAPTFDSLAAPIVNLLRGRAVAGHNVAFDSSFLKFEFGRAGWGWPSVPTLCTLKESFYFLPHLDRRRLADCCVACGIRLDGAHTALGDARATAQLLRNYLDPYVGIAPQAVHRSILSVAASTPWPSAPHGRRIDPQDTRRTLSPRALHVIARPAPSRATSLLERFTLSDAVEEGAPPGVLSYLETLAQVLEDGEISATERAALTDVAELYELTSRDCDTAHRGFVRALAREAFEDGLLSRMEKAEILRLATLIGVDLDAVAELLSGAEETRLFALSADLTPLPCQRRLNTDPLASCESEPLSWCVSRSSRPRVGGRGRGS